MKIFRRGGRGGADEEFGGVGAAMGGTKGGVGGREEGIEAMQRVKRAKAGG